MCHLLHNTLRPLYISHKKIIREEYEGEKRGNQREREIERERERRERKRNL
jgi:hypothetical protein